MHSLCINTLVFIAKKMMDLSQTASYVEQKILKQEVSHPQLLRNATLRRPVCNSHTYRCLPLQAAVLTQPIRARKAPSIGGKNVAQC